MKKVFLLCLLLFFIFGIFYNFYLNRYCNRKSQEVIDFRDLNIHLLADCKDNFLCDVQDEKYIKSKLVSYKCVKREINIFDINYYLNLFK